MWFSRRAYPQRAFGASGGFKEGIQRITPDMSGQELAYMAAYMTQSTTVIRKTAFQRWGGYYCKNSCRYAEDTAFCLKVLLNEAVVFQRRPLAHLDFAASQFGRNFAGPRPIEPFLLDPGDVQKVCPPELVPLLRRYYARCACKTATVLGAGETPGGAIAGAAICPGKQHAPRRFS